MRAIVEIVGDPVALQAGLKYQAFMVSLTRARTTGPGACAGCCVGGCIALMSVELRQASGPSFWLTSGGGTFPPPWIVGRTRKPPSTAAALGRTA